MALIVIGLILWVAAHLFKRVAPAKRAAMGDKGRGPIALILLAAIVFFIVGYRMSEYTHLWDRAGWATPVNNLLMIFALYFTSPGPSKGALFHKMRHPMLTGFLLWVVAHLLVNGDMASLVLFGGLGLWALLEIVVINRAEPNWEPNPKGTIAKDGMFLAISILLVGVIGSIHMLFGLTPFGG